MGKKQHQKDKLYLTTTEWKELGGKKYVPPGTDAAGFKRLPFDYCALSLQPFENPVCDQEGNIFEIMEIVPFLKKFRVNPVTGQPLDGKSLIKLNFSKTKSGEYQCPVMIKNFTQNSHIVAIKTTGNVFSYEAVEELNIKSRNWKDLLTDDSFVRSDIITLQDPHNLGKFNISNFHHMRKNLKIENEELKKAEYDPAARIKMISDEARDTLEELNREYKAPEKIVEEKKLLDKFNAAHYSTGRVAAGFTSTAMEPETVHIAERIEDDLVRYSYVKKKAYLRLLTNLGPLNLELHSDLVPKTCENFLKLCEKGYYTGTKFHRSIKHFMIQGGDPTGTGEGGESLWNKPFNDEFKPNLSHSGRGVLSMANSGPNTNKSQFFITFRSCKHLDGKHTVFGRVVGGLETLSAIERIETDNKDRPIEDIVIEGAQTFVDPYAEADEEVAKLRAEELAKEELEQQAKLAGRPKTEPGVYRLYKESGVGKYLNPEFSNYKRPLETPEAELGVSKKKKEVRSNFDFSNW
ncbi:RING-type E3 ubiquitin-protein ligase PPIL2-like isoform X1 [Artemia franciscana]|uniref:RING-type E3 ubiquitin-protein ligase PPIL2-like isoform X1 n=1 Tax=Artemia franciscana TaxID=6661 RepID=UPI0032DB5448